MFTRDNVTTSRPASTSLLVIDSEDRYSDFNQQFINQATDTGGPYDFRISKNESLMNGFLTRLAVTEIVFPFAVPNVNIKSQSVHVGYNPGTGAVVGTVVLSIGFYTPFQLAAAFQAKVRALNSALASFTISYGADPVSATDQPRFYYSCGIPVAFTPMNWNTTEYVWPRTTKQLYALLGFTAQNAVPSLAGSGEYTFCQYTRYVDFACSQLSNNQQLKDTMSQPIARDILCRLYLDQIGGAFSTNTRTAGDAGFTPTGCVPFTIYRNFTLPKQIQWTPNQPVPGFLQFQVFDDSGAILSEIDNYDTGSMDWSMTLLVTEN